MNANELLDTHGFGPHIRMAPSDSAAIPDTPGVYVIFDRGEVIYVGMAGRDGRGSLKKRLRDHSTGQVVNMFAQYLLFNRILDPENLPRSPQDAGQRCRAYIRQHCSARVLTTPDGATARRIEAQLRSELAPRFNSLESAASAPIPASPTC